MNYEIRFSKAYHTLLNKLHSEILANIDEHNFKQGDLLYDSHGALTIISNITHFDIFYNYTLRSLLHPYKTYGYTELDVFLNSLLLSHNIQIVVVPLPTRSFDFMYRIERTS